MTSYLEKIQKKPERARHRIAIFVSLFVTIIIFGVWASIFYIRLKAPTESPAAISINSPLASVKENTAQAYAGITEQFGEFKVRFARLLKTVKGQ
jgi:spore maturation protein SpmA